MLLAAFDEATKNIPRQPGATVVHLKCKHKALFLSVAAPRGAACTQIRVTRTGTASAMFTFVSATRTQAARGDAGDAFVSLALPALPGTGHAAAFRGMFPYEAWVIEYLDNAGSAVAEPVVVIVHSVRYPLPKHAQAITSPS